MALHGLHNVEDFVLFWGTGSSLNGKTTEKRHARVFKTISLYVYYSGRRRRVIKWAPFVFSRFFGSTSCMVHDYVPTIYKASEPEQVATSDLERSYDL